MKATFTAEQRSLAETIRDMAAGGLSDARALLDGGDPPTQLTEALFGGFAGIGIPEESAGAGGGLVDLAIVLEGLGRSVTPTPFVSHVLALQAAHGAGIDVTDALAGDQRWALAVEGALPARVTGGRLTGDKVAVRDGGTCTHAVAVVDDELVVAPPTSRTPRQALDPSRPLADLTFDAPVAASGGPAADAVRRAQAVLAAEQVGVGRGALDLAVAYAGAREQFGQPIGRFQGVAHQLADAFVGLELAWSLVLYACWAVDAAAADAAAAVHRAQAKAGEAAVFACERAMQVHGGIGITWEADPHLLLRRAVADDAWLGSARRHRRDVGAALVAAASAG